MPKGAGKLKSPARETKVCVQNMKKGTEQCGVLACRWWGMAVQGAGSEVSLSLDLGSPLIGCMTSDKLVTEDPQFPPL